MTTVIVQPEAEADIRSTYNWYESKQEGLGQRFVVEVGNLLSLISEHPQLYPVFHAGTRRGRIKRFPYSVLYIDRGDRLFVLGVLHQHRDPKLGRSRAADFSS